MSHRDSKVEIFNGFDTKFSSGDSNKMQSKQHYREENNNEINELSKDFTDMGCIVDAVKRPPNICIETCVYDESESDDAVPKEEGNADDAYSDAFEEESDGEEAVKLQELDTNDNNIKNTDRQESEIKLSQSHSFMSTKAPASVSGKSSTFGGSVSNSARARRVNMSFSNERLREIERHNNILLNKILSARNTRKSSIPAPRELEPKRGAPAAASMQRKRQQRQIDRDNMILLKKIQGAKSSSYSTRR